MITVLLPQRKNTNGASSLVFADPQRDDDGIEAQVLVERDCFRRNVNVVKGKWKVGKKRGMSPICLPSVS